jgi:DNA-binding NtrC family response regulator
VFLAGYRDAHKYICIDNKEFYTERGSNMHRVLACWIGNTDLRAPEEEREVGIGPIAQACAARDFDRIVLLTDYPDSKVAEYRKWLKKRLSCPLDIQFKPLSGPTNFGEIYESARTAIGEILREDSTTELVFHLSPGTPAMAAVWIILAKTRFPAELIESSQKYGVKTASVPFDLAADFIPDLLRSSDDKLQQLSASEPPEAPEFSDIIHRSRIMQRVIQKARHVAPRSVPVLLEGESGTGKELFARAINKSSPRRAKPFVAVNCGAIPADLVESELFGSEEGAFTGAKRARPGYFENATGGTLFLDEVGELPLSAQVKLLRALQEGEVRRLGGKQVFKVDVRVIAATNRNLIEEIAGGRFRADLFYRLAVAVIKLPPLRDREGDIGLLLDQLLAQVNKESNTEPGYKDKVFSSGARKLMLRHHWPGNVRELLNTVRRAAIWSETQEIGAEDVRDALIPEIVPGEADILNRPLGEGLNLPELLEEVAQHYLTRAVEDSNGNKTLAAQLVGLPSYQTFTNWLARYRVASGGKRALSNGARGHSRPAGS